MEDKITELILSLTKTIKVLQIYGINHPSFKNFYTPFYQKIADYLRHYNELSFQVEKFTLLYGNRIVYEEEEKDINIAFKLFRDGIRNIGFNDGLESNELLRFLEIITQPKKDQDIVLSLWESDFLHINFYVIEEEDEKLEYKIPQVQIENIDYDALINDMTYRERIDINEPVTPDLNFDELKNLKAEISCERDAYSLPLVISTLISFLNIERADEVIESLTKLLEVCVDRRDFLNARRIVYNLSRFTKSSGIEKFENESIILGFKNLVDIQENEIFNEFIAFIGFFSKNSIPYFLKLATAIRRQDRLEALRHRIAYIAQDDVSALIDFLKSDDVMTLANAIAILGIMRSKDTGSLLKPLINHPDPRVRIEVISTLAIIDEPATIAQSIDDSDLEVRIKALHALTQIRYPRIYLEILKRIKNKGFLDLEFTEQKAYLNYLVANGGENLIRHLKKILFKWILFGRKRYRVMRKLAATALAQVNNDEALAVLHEGTKKGNKDIKAACEMALKGK